MVAEPSTEAPLKRKLGNSSGDAESKKSRESSLAVERAPEELLDAPAQSNDEHQTAGQENLAQNSDLNLTGTIKELSKMDRIFSIDRELKVSKQVSGPSSASVQELGEVREGEVLEQDESDDEDGSGELSGLDTENDIEDEDADADEDEDEDEDADADADADEDEDEDVGSDEESDYVSDNEKDGKLTPFSTSSSSQAEAARKDKGKAKVEDVKGKKVMPLDKGKGKAIVEDEVAAVSDEDDAGYLSEDPLEEVDLNNILPTRTRRRSTTRQYDFVDQGNDVDDDDDSDA